MEKPPRILSVDDEPELASTLITLLNRHGYAAVAASTGYKALEIAKEGKFDLIILDIELPDFDGFMVYSALRELHITRATPVIFTSGTPSNNYVTRSRKLGGVDFIAKPFNVATVIGTIGHHSKKLVNLPTAV
jgi:DNA-binding response OmpR family regulator